MEKFFLVLTMLEMLCVNIYTFHICSKKRFSLPVIVLVLGIFTAVLFEVFYLLFGNANILGKGIFMVCGIAYLAPLSFLYRQNVRYSISIMCSSWIYTMLVYALSIQLADFFPPGNSRMVLLLTQTVLYALTIRPFFQFVTGKFMYIIKDIDQKTQKLLFWLGISWFLFAVFLNCALIFDPFSLIAKITKVLVFCVSVANAFMTYQIFYSFRSENRNALEFKRVLRLDALTGLKNRTAFFEEAQVLIDSGTPFTIFYMDLDHFKSINDRYGHIKGDQYLKQFSASFTDRFSVYGTVYRMSGDEFVFLYINGKHDHVVHKKIERFDIKDCDGIPFKGVSMGSASYPEAAQTLNLLIAAADKQMYEKKKMRA